MRSFHIDLRPDIYGDYQGNALWNINEATRASVFIAQTSYLEVSHDLDSRYTLGYDTSFGGGFDHRHTLSITRRALSFKGWSFKAGVVAAEEQFGYMLSANTPVLPGFHLQAEYQSIPYRSFATNESMGTHDDQHLHRPEPCWRQVPARPLDAGFPGNRGRWRGGSRSIRSWAAS